MATKPYKGYCPNWYTDAPKDHTFRQLMKWGDPASYKIPKEGLYKYIKSKFGYTDNDFAHYSETGDEVIDFKQATRLKDEDVKKFAEILGEGNYSLDEYERLKVAYGKTMIDIMRLRKGIIENLPDIVLWPQSKDEIKAIVDYCNEKKIALYVHAGGSSVTRGYEAMHSPNVMVEISKRFNKVVAFNEVDQTITVQPGLSGPNLEKILNNAPLNFGTTQKYTCGHFPQSFEYSCVGGWVVTRGAGQNSTYYGKIEDIVLGQEYYTPAQGWLVTDCVPRKATGPNMDQIMMGNEGTYGFLTEVTLKVFKLSEKHRKFSFMFPDWETGRNAVREMMQGEFGFPSAFRLSDPEETELAMHLYNVKDTPIEKFLTLNGYKTGDMCMMLGFCDGNDDLQKCIVKNVHKIAKKYNGLSMTGYVATSWEHGRFSDPYLRDNCQDYGLIIDTLECACKWDDMARIHKEVRKYVKSWPNAICTTHISHMYPQGGNLYFIFIMRTTDLDEFTRYHAGILDAIQKSGAAMSHHHGIGKLFAPYFERSIGETQMGVLRTLKNYFDPNGIMNPGGTLDLDGAPAFEVKEPMKFDK